MKKGTPIMSDMEWDNMYFTLVDLVYEHPIPNQNYPKIVSKLNSSNQR